MQSRREFSCSWWLDSVRNFRTSSFCCGGFFIYDLGVRRMFNNILYIMVSFFLVRAVIYLSIGTLKMWKYRNEGKKTGIILGIIFAVISWISLCNPIFAAIAGNLYEMEMACFLPVVFSIIAYIVARCS